MSDLNAVVDAYLDVWNEADTTTRKKKIDSLWAENGTYIDPLASVSGRDDFNQVVAGAQAQFKGLKFVRGKTYDEHHNIVRFTWDLVTAEGADAIAVGFDVAVVDESGQIQSVYGFIDKMPAGT